MAPNCITSFSTVRLGVGGLCGSIVSRQTGQDGVRFMDLRLALTYDCMHSLQKVCWQRLSETGARSSSWQIGQRIVDSRSRRPHCNGLDASNGGSVHTVSSDTALLVLVLVLVLVLLMGHANRETEREREREPKG